MFPSIVVEATFAMRRNLNLRLSCVARRSSTHKPTK